MPIPQTDITWQLLQPSTIVILLLMAAFGFAVMRWHKAARRLLGLGLLLTILPALLPIEAFLSNYLESQLPALNQLPGQVDGIVVLGGAVEWRVTEERGQLAVNAAAERLMVAASLARRYPAAHLVFTGLFRESVPQEFTPQGEGFFVGPEYAGRRITYIGEARSTYEEALLTLERVRPQAGETWLLVTSAWHMPRAYLTFQAQGWTLIPYPVDFRSNPASPPAPSFAIIRRLSELDEVVREWGALFIYHRTGRTTRLLP
jgi:uncharacterized SAM-binding protein YcdF (DUF218 family)